MLSDPDRLGSLIDKIGDIRAGRFSVEPLHAIARSYGFSQVAYLGLHLPQLTREGPFVYVTYPESWVEHYKELDFVTTDPVVTATANALLPVNWDSLDVRHPKARQMFGEAREFGIGARGLTMTIRGAHGERALLSLTSDLPAAEWQDFCRQNVGDFQILAYHIHKMVLSAHGISPAAPHLSAREFEVLKWISSGKTISDSADILGLSDRTVKFYLENVRHKLNCLNTTHAVARAISLGLIPPSYF
jgi:DNA-binding CsgD family transcriptional regulator